MGDRLHGKVALVTGAARGLGEAQARLFAEQGAVVVLTDVDADRGSAVAADLGGPASFRRLDVRREEDWAAVVNECTSTYGGVDVLVNNAGTGTDPGPIECETTENHLLLVDLNLSGVWRGIRAVIPAMRARGGGSIVNISSIDGLAGVAGMATYTATKFAVTGLTRTTALELGRHGIRVNSVHPGIMQTPLIEGASESLRKRLQDLVGLQPIPRIGRPVEVAHAALFLASDESSYCTGSGIVVDGGHLAGPHRPGFDTA